MAGRKRKPPAVKSIHYMPPYSGLRVSCGKNPEMFKQLQITKNLDEATCAACLATEGRIPSYHHGPKSKYKRRIPPPKLVYTALSKDDHNSDEQDYTLHGPSCWITVGNVSVYIRHDDKYVIVELSPKGLEGGECAIGNMVYIAKEDAQREIESSRKKEGG